MVTKSSLLGLSLLISARSEEHTSELQSQSNLVCRLLLEKKNRQTDGIAAPPRLLGQLRQAALRSEPPLPVQRGSACPGLSRARAVQPQHRARARTPPPRRGCWNLPFGPPGRPDADTPRLLAQWGRDDRYAVAGARQGRPEPGSRPGPAVETGAGRANFFF